MLVDEIVRRVRERSARLASGLPVPALPVGSDFSLNGIVPVPEKYRAASVLVPIVNRASEVTILLTQRTADMPSHAGQVAFPGGRSDPTDVSLVETALRETQEETGIDPAFVTVAGFLDAYETGTGYAILPVVGLLSDGFALSPHAAEVAEIFEVPLSFLLDPVNRKMQSREFQGRVRSFYSFTYEGHYIWGATAAMLLNFGERITKP